MDPTEIQEKMDALVEAAESESRSMTDEEMSKYEGLEKDLLRANKTAQLKQRHATYSAPITGAPAVIKAVNEGDKAVDRAFEAYLRTGQHSMELTQFAQTEGSDAPGGYTVPPGFLTKLVERTKAFGGIATKAEVIETSTGQSLEWPTLDDTSNEGDIASEGSGTAAGADLVFGTVTLGAYKYTTAGASNNPLKVSVELLQDSAFDIAGLVSRKLGERIARAQAADFAAGTGSGGPTGLFHSPAETQTASGGAVTYSAILDLIHAVDPSYRDAGAAFIMNDGTLKLVREIVDNNGRPLWMPSFQAGLQDMPGGILLGYPVIVDQGSPAWSATATDNVSGSPVAGEGYMAFGDIIEAYIIRRVRSVVVVVNPYTSGHLGLVEYSAFARADATIQNRNAYALLQGYHA